MGKIQINTGNVTDAGKILNSVKTRTSQVQSDVQYIWRSVDSRILSRHGINSSFSSLCGRLRNIEDKVAEITRVINAAAQNYEATEDRIVIMARAVPERVWAGTTVIGSSFSGFVSQIPGSPQNVTAFTNLGVVGGGAIGLAGGGQAGSGSTTVDKLIALWNDEAKTVREDHYRGDEVGNKESEDQEEYEEHSWGFLKGTSEAGLSVSALGYDNDTFFSDKFKHPIEQKKTTKKEKNKDTDWYDKNGTILEVKAEHKVEGSLFETVDEGKSKYAQGTQTFSAGTGEAHAAISAGMYVYERKSDGSTERKFAPGVDAEIGVSASALKVVEEGRVGLGKDNNLLGAYGEAEFDVLTAEAKAQGTFSVYGDDGKLNIQAYGKASAEADWVKLEGTAGVSVLGADVGVKGAVKVGVGAHAEAGIVDGKIKIDVGVAVGIGFDLGLEIDAKGAIDTVCSAAKSVWDWLTDW